jgi:hypothetical protein
MTSRLRGEGQPDTNAGRAAVAGREITQAASGTCPPGRFPARQITGSNFAGFPRTAVMVGKLTVGWLPDRRSDLVFLRETAAELATGRGSGDSNQPRQRRRGSGRRCRIFVRLCGWLVLGRSRESRSGAVTGLSASAEYFAAWRDDGTAARLHEVLRAQARAAADRDRCSSSAVLALSWPALSPLRSHPTP